MPDLRFGAVPSRLGLGLGLALAMMGATSAVLPFYPGQSWILMLFGAAATSLAIFGFVASQSAFCRVLTLFLCLGFWAKLIIHLLGAKLIEPVGRFDGSPAAWDWVLLVAAAALGAVALAIALCSRLDRQRSSTVKVQATRFARLAIALFVLSAAVAVVLFGFNRLYAILTIGFVPRIELPNYVYVTIAFTVSWGAMLWLGALTFWLVRQGRWPADALFYLAAAEGALAATSMASRAQMVLHVLAVVMVYILWHRRLRWSIPRRRWCAIVAVTGVLLAGSLAAVSADRLQAYHTAVPASPTKAVRTDARGFARKLSDVQIELARLVVMRWIGLEGVMAMTAADGLGFPLFMEVLRERPQAGNDAIYQRLSHSRYERLRDFVFLTLPGPAAVLMSSGSLLIAALGMMLLVFAGYAIERIADLWTSNPVASGVAGCALAFLIANTNFPWTLFSFSLTLVLALGAIGAFRVFASFLSESIAQTDTGG